MQKLGLYFATAVLVALLVPSTTSARTPSQFLPLSLSYAWPSGGLADQTAADPAVGFSLGYLYGTSKHFHIGARGTWSRYTLGQSDSLDYTGYGLTHVGIMAGVHYRFIKHGWTPFVEAEAGMGIMFADQEIGNVPQRIDGLSEVKFSYAGVAGVLFPLSETIELTASGRYTMTFITNNFSTIAAHVGIIYALR